MRHVNTGVLLFKNPEQFLIGFHILSPPGPKVERRFAAARASLFSPGKGQGRQDNQAQGDYDFLH
jgi:hypothetical protein